MKWKRKRSVDATATLVIVVAGLGLLFMAREFAAGAGPLGFGSCFLVIVLGVTGGVVGGAIDVRRRRRAHAVARGHCARCGYDLRATPDRCPECGTERRPSPHPYSRR